MEKKEVLEDTRPVSISSERDVEPRTATDDPNWQPGFRARFPWLGLGALIGVLIFLALSVTVLVKANHTSQTVWTKWIPGAHPNVLITVLNSLSSICFTIAIGNGVAIAWWRKTLKGASIADLDRSYKFGTSIKEVVLSLKYFNVLALGALTAKLTLIDGVLMQRAFNTYTATDMTPIAQNVTGYSNQTFPMTGTVVGDDEQPGVMMHWMGDTLKMWSQNGGIYKNEWTGCEGLCYANVPGIGFAFNCNEQTVKQINYGETLLDAKSANLSETLFSISFNAHYVDAPGKSSYLSMDVTYTNASEADGDQKSCPGKQFSQSCKLWPAIINYPVVIANTSAESSVSLGENKPYANGTANYGDLHPFDLDLQQQKGFDVLQRLNIQESHNSSSDDVGSAISGIQLALMMYIRGHAKLSWQDNENYFLIQQMGHSANYMTDPPMDPESCAFGYTNPLVSYHAPNGLFEVPSVVAKINQIMFGLSTDISLDNPKETPPVYHSYNSTEYQVTIHYLTQFPYVFGAVAATFCCILLVLPLYWGFWEIGRKVSLNPFEIAHAFRSPVVAQASSPVTDELIQQVGDRQIRYGPIIAGDGRGQFGVAEPQNVAEARGQGGLRASWYSNRMSMRSN